MIVGIEGNLGNGKSATMARMALHYSSLCCKCNGIIRGEYVIPILFDEGASPHKCECLEPKPYKIHANFWINKIADIHYVTTVDDINKIYDGYAFLDEFWSWIDSRVSGYSDINMAVTGILHKSRKRGFSIIYESKLIHMTDRRIRELTDYVLRPNKYIASQGELIKVEQNMLYPISIEPYLDDTWIVVDELSGSMLETVSDSLFQFKLSDIVNLYDTKEEIADLKSGESSPGIEKGMGMETNFGKAVKQLVPDCEILRGKASRGWDLIITIGNKIKAFDVVSPRKPHKGSRNASLDIRSKKIESMLKTAHKKDMQPFWGFNYDGKWWCMPMTEEHILKGTISCKDAKEINEVFI